MKESRLLIYLSALMLLLINGCKTVTNEPKPADFYRPPTAERLPSPVFAPSATPPDSSSAPTLTPMPTSTPPCTDNLSFLEDITIQDGTVVSPGETLDKRWRVANNGTCNWDERYRVKLIAGPNLGVTPEQALYPARSGSQSTIHLVLTAPAEIGTYRSAWQAFSPQEEPFGDPFFIEFTVASPEESQ